MSKTAYHMAVELKREREKKEREEARQKKLLHEADSRDKQQLIDRIHDALLSFDPMKFGIVDYIDDDPNRNEILFMHGKIEDWEQSDLEHFLMNTPEVLVKFDLKRKLIDKGMYVWTAIVSGNIRDDRAPVEATTREELNAAVAKIMQAHV